MSTRRPLTDLERQLAGQLVQTRLQAVTLTAFDELDPGPLLDLHDQVAEAFLAKYGVALSLLPFFLKAVVVALKQVPVFMSHIDGDDRVECSRYDLSVAVDSSCGYAQPVLRDCDGASIAELAAKLAGLTARVRTGELTVPELLGGVLALTHRDGMGPLFATPALNSPQSAALVIHPIQQRPVARGGRVVVRPLMNLSLSYDARLIPDAAAAAFLAHFKSAITAPVGLLFNG